MKENVGPPSKSITPVDSTYNNTVMGHSSCLQLGDLDRN